MNPSAMIVNQIDMPFTVTSTSRTARASKLVMSAVCAGALFFTASSAGAADPVLTDEWRFSVTPYVWVPEITSELSTGSEFEIGMDDLISNLNMAGLGRFEARRSKWSFAVDGVYLNLGMDGGGTLNVPDIPGVEAVNADVKLRTWIWTLTGGYNLWRSDRGTLDLIAGARYLEIAFSLDASKRIGPFASTREESDLGTNVNAIIGVRGDIRLNDRWFVPYHLDAGTGEIDLTWQVAAGVGYRFDWGDVGLLYRHMEWDFGSGEKLDNLKARGPMLSATFRF